MITALNIIGVSIIGKLQKVIVGIVLTLLIVMSVYGLSTIDLTYLESGFTKGASGFMAAAAFVYVSYAGVTKVAAIAEEVKDPGRNLPLGILISWIVVMCIYVFVVFVLVTNVPYKGTDKQRRNRPTGPETDLHGCHSFGWANCWLHRRSIGCPHHDIHVSGWLARRISLPRLR